MNRILVIPVALALLVSGCQERVNPLITLSSEDVAEWIFKNRTDQIDECSSIWAKQDDASDTDLHNCESVSEMLATKLTKGGFGDILASDVTLPTIWGSYSNLLQVSNRNTFDAHKAGEAMKLKPSNSLGNRIEQYKNQRDSE